MITTTSRVYWSSKYHSLGQSSTTQFDFFVPSRFGYFLRKLWSQKISFFMRSTERLKGLAELWRKSLKLPIITLFDVGAFCEKPDIIMFCWALLVYNETTVIYSRWYLLVLLLLPQLVKETTNDGIMSNNLIPGSVPLLWSLLLKFYFCIFFSSFTFAILYFDPFLK